MKRIKPKDKKGQTLLEIIAVLVIIGVILSAAIPAVTASTDTGRVQSALSTIRSIQGAATSFYNDNNGTYASISNAGLVPKYLPNSGTGNNAGVIPDPWGGAVTVAGVSGVTNQYTITMTSVPAAAQTALTNDLQNSSIKTSSNGDSYQVTLS